VGIERFVATLRDIGFRGSLNVEREVESQAERIGDIRKAVQLLRRLAGG
jgi:sugar phosphate isomerase/epimerase